MITADRHLEDGLLDQNGFAIVPGVIEPQEIDGTLAALPDGSARRFRAGLRHLLGDPAIEALARAPRLLELAEALTGRPTIPFRATLFDKSESQNWLVVWHQDTALPIRRRREVPGWGPWSVKEGIAYAHAPADALASIVALRVHLDDSDPSNGPLRVLPSTHRLGVLSDEAVQQLSRATEPVECLVGRGGIVAMRPLIVHASSKATSDAPRRVIHIEYAPSLDLGNGLELAIA